VEGALQLVRGDAVHARDGLVQSVLPGQGTGFLAINDNVTIPYDAVVVQDCAVYVLRCATGSFGPSLLILSLQRPSAAASYRVFMSERSAGLKIRSERNQTRET
jgi:hypothetical protein